MIGRKVEERQQRLPILIRHSTALSYLGVYFSAKVAITASAEARSDRNLRAEPCAHWVAATFRELVSTFKVLCGRAWLITGRERTVERLPETERAVADRGFRRDRQPARFQVDEQLLPTLRALAHARLKADQFLPASRRRPHQNEHAFGLRLHARLQIDAVRPDVDVVARRRIACCHCRYSSSHSLLRRPITAAERLGASLPSKAARASWKSPAEIPRR